MRWYSGEHIPVHVTSIIENVKVYLLTKTPIKADIYIFLQYSLQYTV
jgi:hypothetical protein